MSTPVVLITRALTGIGRTFSRALGFTDGDSVEADQDSIKSSVA